MRIVVAGGTGFLGRPLCSALGEEGHEVLVLSRAGEPAREKRVWTGTPGVRTWPWSIGEAADVWWHAINESDIVVNLAGESIAARRWSTAQKALLERSRIDSTRALVEAISAAAHPPHLFLSGSAVGYYGSRGDEVLTEESPPGADFLAGLSVRWEAEAMRGASPRTRVIRLRTGVVLARDGGALAKMLPPFRLGLGGPLASGRQYMSWIHRDDWVGLVRRLLTSDIEGAVNLVAPTPVTNKTFTKTLGAALGRPTLLAAPAFALRLALGEMAGPLLLASQRAIPARALEATFAFRFETIRGALEDILKS